MGLYYFTEKTEWAIVEYNNAVDVEKKDELFRKYIEFPFFKLAENIIYTYKFRNLPLDPSELKGDVVSFLITKIDKFDPTRGKKAFSFFGKVAKNYLIYLSNKNAKYNEKHIKIDKLTNYQKNSVLYEVDKKLDKSEHEESARIAKELNEKLILYLETNITTLFKKQEDRIIVWGLLKILKNHRDLVEKYNKKLLYLLIREYSSQDTPRISRVVNKIKKMYIHIKDQYYLTEL